MKGGGKGRELTPKLAFRKDAASAPSMHTRVLPHPQELLGFLQYPLTEDQGVQSLVQGSWLTAWVLKSGAYLEPSPSRSVLPSVPLLCQECSGT